MKVVAVIQARMASTRLPGKVMMKINGISVLQCLTNQLSHATLLDRTIIATTHNKNDDVIVDLARSLKLDSFRGNSLDVLDRYYQCAKHFSLNHIVRITSDCPLLDPEIIDKTISLYNKGNFDYVNNFSKKRYPYGTEVEVFSFETIEKAWRNAEKPSEREHVTPYIYNNPDKFVLGSIEPNVDLSNLHWSVDRIADLELVRFLYKKINHRPIHVDDILKVITEDPSVLEINKNSDPNEGYLKSLQYDKEATT